MEHIVKSWDSVYALALDIMTSDEIDGIRSSAKAFEETQGALESAEFKAYLDSRDTTTVIEQTKSKLLDANGTEVEFPVTLVADSTYPRWADHKSASDTE